MSFDTSNGRHTDRMHPFVYVVMLALAVVLILSVWGFAAGAHTGLMLTIASLFVLIALLLPAVLWHIARRQGDRGISHDPLLRWMNEQLDTYSGSEPAREAALSVLLPVFAVSVGMMVFALVRHFAVPGA
jgi:uncharacterized membrane protein YhaH (DUF805 family)